MLQLLGSLSHHMKNNVVRQGTALWLLCLCCVCEAVVLPCHSTAAIQYSNNSIHPLGFGIRIPNCLLARHRHEAILLPRLILNPFSARLVSWPHCTYHWNEKKVYPVQHSESCDILRFCLDSTWFAHLVDSCQLVTHELTIVSRTCKACDAAQT